MNQRSQMLLTQAFADYSQAQSEKIREVVRKEMVRFTRWCGRDKATSSLTPLEVEEYCSTLEGVGEERSQRLAALKGFLAYLHRQSLISVNLATHVKLRRTARRASTVQKSRRPVAASQLTQDGHQRLQAELAALKAVRVGVVEDIRKAAATKDFSENAPLDAARERQGQMEARIRDLEETLRGAMVLEELSGEERAHTRVAIGSRVVLRQPQTGQEVSYLLVEPSEADPTGGKLSAASPVGKAVLERTEGDEIEVTTPRGAVRYVVAKVGA